VRRDLTALLLRRAAAGAQAMPASGQLRLDRFLRQMHSLAGRRPDRSPTPPISARIRKLDKTDTSWRHWPNRP
jgi:hypothetical protein